jgi:hypothetical protein
VVVGSVRAAWSDRRHGDLRPGPDGDRPLTDFVAGVTGHPVDPLYLRWLRQVHGATVVEADRVVGQPPPEGDGLVAVGPDDRLVIFTADCASIALGSPEGVYAAVHAGWRGLVAGVVEAAADAMRSQGATQVHGAVGPVIHPECYEFAAADLDSVAGRLGDRVRGRTSEGRPALDLPAAVGEVFDRAGVRPVEGDDACTSCSGRHFSHRARGDIGRQALVVWSVDV